MHVIGDLVVESVFFFVIIVEINEHEAMFESLDKIGLADAKKIIHGQTHRSRVFSSLY